MPVTATAVQIIIFISSNHTATQRDLSHGTFDGLKFKATFSLTEFVSSDIDECSSGVSQCHEHASCTNSDPGYCCECNEGYFGTGFICEKEGKTVIP